MQGYSYPSDIWAVGLTILEVAAGKYPYKSTEMFDLFADITSDVPPLDCLPVGHSFSPDFFDFVEKCLRKVRPGVCFSADVLPGAFW